LDDRHGHYGACSQSQPGTSILKLPQFALVPVEGGLKKRALACIVPAREVLAHAVWWGMAMIQYAGNGV
jgi:hypothetical protein